LTFPTARIILGHCNFSHFLLFSVAGKQPPKRAIAALPRRQAFGGDRMKKALWPALAVVALLVVGFYVWYLYPRNVRPTPDNLKQEALTGATPEAKQAAAAQLSDWGAEALPQMREVLAGSDVPEVRAMMVQGLGKQYDYESMELLLKGLEDESVEVRERSAQVVRVMLGRSVPFNAAGPTAERAAAVAAMRKEWEELQKSPLLKNFQERLKRGEAPPSG
jgi:hypothetical protein